MSLISINLPAGDKRKPFPVVSGSNNVTVTNGSQITGTITIDQNGPSINMDFGTGQTINTYPLVPDSTGNVYVSNNSTTAISVDISLQTS